MLDNQTFIHLLCLPELPYLTPQTNLKMILLLEWFNHERYIHRISLCPKLELLSLPMIPGPAR